MKLFKYTVTGVRNFDPQYEELAAALYADREYIIEQIESIIGQGDIIDRITVSQYNVSIYLKDMDGIGVPGITLISNNDNLTEFQSYDELLDFVIHSKINRIEDSYRRLLASYTAMSNVAKFYRRYRG